MGDINFDLSREPRFRVIPFACGAIGATAAVFAAPAALPGGMLTAAAVGFVAGGIGLPVAGVVAAIGAVALVKMGKALVDTLKQEGPLLPLGMVVVGLSSAKTLFVTPFTSGWNLAKKLKPGGTKPGGNGVPPAAAVDAGETPSKLAGKTAGKDFKAAAKDDGAKTKAKPQPKPKDAPKP